MSDPRAAADGAIDWLTRQRDPLFDDWDGLTAWLEADAAHAEAYQRLMALDAALAADLALDPPRAVSQQAQDDAPDPAPGAGARRRFGWRAALAAASIALVALTSLAVLRPADRGEIVATASERKHLLLGDGSRVVLNSGSRLRLDPSAPRAVTLERGEALFEIVHDPQRRFRVTFDGGMVENLGTRFTVSRDGSRTEVAVAQGAVAYRGEAGQSELRPGDRLIARGTTMKTDRVAVAAVGSWATPRLVYDNVPLRRVAADLSRELGVRVRVATEVAERPVAATIQLDLDARRSVERLGPLLDLEVRREGEGWLLAPTR